MYYDFRAAGGGGAKAYYLGEYASGASIDVGSKYADYAMLTADNFIIQSKGTSISYTGNRAGSHKFTNGLEPGERADISVAGQAAVSAPSVSYNSSTGILSFTQTISGYASAGIWDSTSEASKSGSGAVTAKVYLVTEIENL